MSARLRARRVTSARSDIESQISTDGGKGRTGQCNPSNLMSPINLNQTIDGVTNKGGDQ
jgi:hypothetical protein